jgi:hypothetical protein
MAENLALCYAEAEVGENPVLDASMKQSEYSRRIRAKFLKSPSRPTGIAYDGSGCEMDSRRWDGRSAESCGKQWSKIKSPCVKFHSCMERLKGMELTGNPTEDDFKRCAISLYNSGSATTSHLYDVINNAEYRIGNLFPFLECYDWLSTSSSILNCSPVDIHVVATPDQQNAGKDVADISADDAGRVESYEASKGRGGDIQGSRDVCSSHAELTTTGSVHGKRSRPIGTKAAKKTRLEAANDIAKLEVSVSDVAKSSAKFSVVYEKAQSDKLKNEQRKLKLAEDRLNFEKMQALLSSGSCLTEIERRNVERALLASIDNNQEGILPVENRSSDISVAPHSIRSGDGR